MRARWAGGKRSVGKRQAPPARLGGVSEAAAAGAELWKRGGEDDERRHNHSIGEFESRPHAGNRAGGGKRAAGARLLAAGRRWANGLCGRRCAGLGAARVKCGAELGNRERKGECKGGQRVHIGLGGGLTLFGGGEQLQREQLPKCLAGAHGQLGSLGGQRRLSVHRSCICRLQRLLLALLLLLVMVLRGRLLVMVWLRRRRALPLLRCHCRTTARQLLRRRHAG